MAFTTQSTYMLLDIPVVGQDPGPQWALDINQALAAIDAHDHSPSHGVQITPSGLNINTDLSINNNSLSLIKSMELASQLSLLSGAAKLYMSGQDLYFNDGQSNQVRITQNGSVAISGAVGFTGLPSGTASAAYLSGPQTFRFQSATDTPANLDGSSLTIRKQAVNGNGITVSAPTAISTNYSLVLPPDPTTQGGTKILRLDTSGNISSTLGIDTSSPPTIEIASDELRVKDGGITAVKLASSSVITTKIADGNVILAKLGTMPFGHHLAALSGSAPGSFTVPAGITSIVVELFGPGGGGGGGARNGDTGGTGGMGGTTDFYLSSTSILLARAAGGSGGAGGHSGGGGGGGGGGGCYVDGSLGALALNGEAGTAGSYDSSGDYQSAVGGGGGRSGGNRWQFGPGGLGGGVSYAPGFSASGGGGGGGGGYVKVTIPVTPGESYNWTVGGGGGGGAGAGSGAASGNPGGSGLIMIWY